MALPSMAKLIVTAMGLALILASASAAALAAGGLGNPGLNQGGTSRASKPGQVRTMPQEDKTRARELKGSGNKAGDELKAGEPPPGHPRTFGKNPRSPEAARPNRKSEMDQTSRRGVC